MRLFGQVHVGVPKVHVDGTHRTRSPRETLEAYLPMRAEFGITRLANVTGLDNVGIPTYQCIRPNARSLSLSQGKGLTLDAAKASALMESIEAWHAERPTPPTCYATANVLATHAAVIDAWRLPRESSRPVHDEIVLPWIEGYDIARDERVWVPHEFVSVDWVMQPGQYPLFQNTSNGLASGNHVLEAVTHALCEVIERDAKTLWIHDASNPTGTASLVDQSTIDDPACLYVLGKLRAAEVTIAIYDITSDVGVPCYYCVIVDRPDSLRPLGLSYGQGCHLAREVALLRALTEAAQDRLTIIAGSRDDKSYEDYRRTRDRRVAGGVVRYLQKCEHKLDFRARPSVATSTFDGDVAVLVERLQKAGCASVAVVDLTHVKYRIPVVKVVVPGLEGVNSSTYVLGERARAKTLHGALS